MAISVNYPTPVLVNGYLCRNCTDVANAQNHIDPAHPQDGPFGVNAASDPAGGRGASVSLGGRLSALGAPAAAAAPTQPYAPGSLLSVAA
jgi:hypothetical protein